MKYVNPYNTVEFYVGEITEPQTVKIYTDLNTSVDNEVREGNKWYTYVLPKDKGLCMIEGDSVKKVVVKANISYEPRYITPFTYGKIIPSSTVEASFKGSKLNITDIKGIFQSCNKLTSLDVSSFDTSKVTDMSYMFQNCSDITYLNLSNFNTSNVNSMHRMFDSCEHLESLDLSKWDTSKVTSMKSMFTGCKVLNEIKMVGCSEDTVNKIKDQLESCHITGVTITT